MTDTKRNLLEQFTDSVIRWKNNLKKDQFFIAKIKLAVLYFFAAALIFTVLGIYTDDFLRTSFYSIALSETGTPVKQAFIMVEQQLWLRRIVQIFLFGILAYILATFAMRPLKRSATLQKRFIAMVSHQFKTPLAIIKTSQEVALRDVGSLTKEELIGIVASNLDEVNKLSSIIQFLTTFSQFGDTKTNLPLEKLILSHVIENTISKLKKMAIEKNITIGVDITSKAVIRGNEVALTELLSNLLDNALRYTKSGGSIGVSLKDDNNDVVLSVADSGIGIGKEDLSHIFQPFFRGRHEGTKEKSRGNLGLGLYLVKEIADIHRAKISVESSGKGTNFHVRFPKYE